MAKPLTEYCCGAHQIEVATITLAKSLCNLLNNLTTADSGFDKRAEQYAARGGWSTETGCPIAQEIAFVFGPFSPWELHFADYCGYYPWYSVLRAQRIGLMDDDQRRLTKE